MMYGTYPYKPECNDFCSLAYTLAIGKTVDPPTERKEFYSEWLKNLVELLLSEVCVL
jgi:hypothetical protein